MKCDVCFRHCDIPEGGTGACRARKCVDGQIVCGNYGRITGIALDPVEKKPLAMYMSGSMILSVGSYGCNLRCPFCQNHEISYAGEEIETRQTDPEELLYLARSYVPRGNIGVAYTYNEPLIGWEFVRDTGKLVHGAGMKNVLVSNGTCEERVEEEILPFIDAINIDLKCFSGDAYRNKLGGDLDMTMAFIEKAAGHTHLEITTLIVPGISDSPSEMEEMTKWITSLPGGCDIPYHVTRYFPRFKMSDVPMTPAKTLYDMAEIAGKRLNHVFTGNI